MSVAVVDHSAFVKIPGRANFSSSVDFKSLICELRERGFDHFVLDLGDCVTMDSTFLGVLAGFAMRNADESHKQGEPNSLRLDLLNPNGRVTDLLENLGVMHMFNIVNQENPCTLLFEPATGERPPVSKLEQAQTCLDAHNNLIKINPNNAIKFTEVARFLAEDLRKLKEEKKEA